MLSYAQALKIILEGVTPLATRVISLDQALSQVVAKSLHAAENIPPFNNSAMDGFAVNSCAIQGAGRDHPIILNVDGSTMAGDIIQSWPEREGTGAWEIMTGAPVPDGYDAVIRIEDIEILARNDQDRPTKIAVMVEGFPGKNIRNAGTDFCPDDLLIEKTVTIEPHHIMALAALGHNDIPVMTPPNVAIISTGKELVDEMDRALLPGQIRNSNAPYLMQSLNRLGIPATNEGTIFDEPEKFEQKIAEILSKDINIILSSGAVSMGRYDFVPEGLRKMGAKILFHKAAIKPGKPILFARFPNGAYYFGLPGNPIAAAVGLRFFAYPLMRKLLGLAPEIPVRAKLQEAFTKESAFRFFLKANYNITAEGHMTVEILPGQESFKIKPMLSQNCWAVIGEDDLSLNAQSIVEIYPLYPRGMTGDLG